MLLWILVNLFLFLEVQFRLNDSFVPSSICSLPCPEGVPKKYDEGESCCWTCVPCGDYQVTIYFFEYSVIARSTDYSLDMNILIQCISTFFQILDSEDDTRCKKCPPGELPDSKKLNCTKLPEEYMTLTSYWAMGSQSFALLGIILTVTVIIVFLKYNDTPVVRASGRELSYVLLFGLLFCYLVTFLFVIRPTTIICAIEQFSIGVCFSVVYGALFIKTNRISRIFAASKKTSKRPNFISPKSQLIMCSGIVFVQVLINIIWFLVSPPEADYYRPIPETNILACKVIHKVGQPLRNRIYNIIYQMSYNKLFQELI